MLEDLLHIEHGHVAVDQVKHMPCPQQFEGNEDDIVITIDTYVPETKWDFDEYEQGLIVFIYQRKNITKSDWEIIYSAARLTGFMRKNQKNIWRAKNDH